MRERHNTENFEPVDNRLYLNPVCRNCKHSDYCNNIPTDENNKEIEHYDVYGRPVLSVRECKDYEPRSERKLDLISRQDALDALKKAFDDGDGIEVGAYWEHNKVIDTIKLLPSADRLQGEWIVKDGVFYCSCCDNDSAGLSEDDVYVYEVPLPNYCSNCGAKMKGGENHE